MGSQFFSSNRSHDQAVTPSPPYDSGRPCAVDASAIVSLGALALADRNKKGGLYSAHVRRMLLDRCLAGGGAGAGEIFGRGGGGAASPIELGGGACAFRRPGRPGKGGESEPGRPIVRRSEKHEFVRVSVGRAGIVGMAMSECDGQAFEIASKKSLPRQIVTLTRDGGARVSSHGSPATGQTGRGGATPLAPARVINHPPVAGQAGHPAKAQDEAGYLLTKGEGRSTRSAIVAWKRSDTQKLRGTQMDRKRVGGSCRVWAAGGLSRMGRGRETKAGRGSTGRVLYRSGCEPLKLAQGGGHVN